MILRKSILTRDILLYRGGDYPVNCLFCGKNESINHLFFECPLARYIWNIVSCATGIYCQFQSANQYFNVWLKSFLLNKRNGRINYSTRPRAEIYAMPRSKAFVTEWR
jgi:hypothetical protein